MPVINNYTTQTNSHKGYTIEELRRLFGEGKTITSENLIQLINQCFNYELVSGNGIRILELKNNDLKENTTKTYKIECTGNSGGGGGTGDVKANYGVKFDVNEEVADKNTIIANLYDYSENGRLNDDDIYPVSLSKDGKLIVDMSQSELIVLAKSEYPYYPFCYDDISHNFTFKVKIKGHIEVYKIETWLEENETEIQGSKQVYDDESRIVQDINNNPGQYQTLYRDCSARIGDNQNAAITRTGKIKVYYYLKGESYNKTESASTRFMHQIYYGYTCDYNTTRNSSHIAPDRLADNPNIVSQPCFKIYSPNDADYDNNDHTTGKRTGLSVIKDSNTDKYKLSIQNTETGFDYILGYYDTNTPSSDQDATLCYVPDENVTGNTFNLTGLGNNGGISVFVSFLIPKSMGEITSMISSIDGCPSWEILDGMLVEKAIVKDYSYFDNGNDSIDLEYTVYTQKTPFSTSVESNIDIECTVSTI